jgi:hypothetical protein
MGVFGADLKFNRVPEKVPEKVRLWCRARSGSTGFRRRSGGFGAKPSPTGFAALITHGNPAEVFAALGSAARFRKNCKNLTLRLLGILLKFFVTVLSCFIYIYLPTCFPKFSYDLFGLVNRFISTCKFV